MKNKIHAFYAHLSTLQGTKGNKVNCLKKNFWS